MSDINDSHHKGLGNPDTLPKDWSLLKGDLSLPTAILDLEKVSQNLSWMESFLESLRINAKLAPHGKTTMMPCLFKKACKLPSTWGMTLANATQVKVAHDFGISKVLMANQLVGERNMAIISEILEKDKDFEFLSLIDSPEIVEQLGTFFSQRNQSIKILLEYGPRKGRTGVRDAEQEAKVLQALRKWKDTVKLVGVEFFEGVPVLQSEDEISNFIDFAIERVKMLLSSRDLPFGQREPFILTGSGSSWIDIVAQKFKQFFQQGDNKNVQLIFRSGCYMSHDAHTYDKTSSRLKEKFGLQTSLQPALKLWAYVQSIPEPNLAILTLGRRDAGVDAGYPVPALHFHRRGDLTLPIKAPSSWSIFNMNDQHSYMQVQEGDDIQVGDMIAFDILHPCTTFDKWRRIICVDNERDLTVVEVAPTFF